MMLFQLTWVCRRLQRIQRLDLQIVDDSPCRTMICPASISRWRGSTCVARGLARRVGGVVVARAIGDDKILRDLADQLRLLLVEIDRDEAGSRAFTSSTLVSRISCAERRIDHGHDLLRDALPRVFRQVENLIDRFG